MLFDSWGNKMESVGFQVLGLLVLRLLEAQNAPVLGIQIAEFRFQCSRLQILRKGSCKIDASGVESSRNLGERRDCLRLAGVVSVDCTLIRDNKYSFRNTLGSF